MSTDGTFVKELRESLGKPGIETVGGEERLVLPPGWTQTKREGPKVAPINLGTLTGLVDYLKANVDKLDPATLIVHAADHANVWVGGRLGTEREEFRRQYYAHANTALVSGTLYPFGQWLDKEAFMIALQTGFVPSGEREQALKLVASISENWVRETADDGVAQSTKTARSVTMAENSRVPNPILLRPYRTFREVDQPGSLFVFRLREGKDAPTCALFEADGGAWKLEAVRSIAAYLRDALGTGYAVIG